MTTRTRRPVMKIAVSLLKGLRWTLIGYWTVLLIVAVVLTILIGEGDSDWSAAMPAKYFLFALGVMLSSIFLPIFVVYGITRREFLLGALTFSVISCLLFGVMGVVTRVMEILILNARGMSASGGDGALLLAVSPLVSLAFMLVGALIGAFFYRYGWKIGLALLPLGILLIVATEFFTALDWAREVLAALDLPVPSPAVTVISAVVSCLVAGLLSHRVLRDVPIRTH